MGEGGAVITNSNRLKLSVDSFRDWEEIVGARVVTMIPAEKDSV